MIFSLNCSEGWMKLFFFLFFVTMARRFRTANSYWDLDSDFFRPWVSRVGAKREFSITMLLSPADSWDRREKLFMHYGWIEFLTMFGVFVRSCGIFEACFLWVVWERADGPGVSPFSGFLLWVRVNRFWCVCAAVRVWNFESRFLGGARPAILFLYLSA